MKHIIFFDFDGVIVDTLALSVEIFQQQDPTMTADRLRVWLEDNVLEGVRENNLSPRDFFAEYAKRLPLVPPIEGIPGVLSQLSQQFTLIIISSSLSTILADYVQQYKMGAFISDIVGSDKEGQKRDNFRHALKQHGSSAANCIFVTDTLGDIHEARALNIKTIAATWGFHSQPVLASGNPEAFATTPQDLPLVIGRLFSAIF